MAAIKIGNTYFHESCINLTYDEFKEFVTINSLGQYMLIDVDLAYDILQGCEGCKDKKVVKKPVIKKKKTTKKKP